MAHEPDTSHHPEIQTGANEAQRWPRNHQIATDRLEAANQRVETLQAENAELRKIISRCCAAIGNGSACSPDASLDFLGCVPGEIATHIERLRYR